MEECASLYLTGGRQKSRALDEWHAYESGIILRLDGAGCITTATEYTSPPEACPDDEPSVSFKAGSILGNRLYVPTNTEVVIYEIPSFRQIGYLSLPWFNDIHHVCPARNGNLLVVSTGLDMVAEVTSDGSTAREWAVLGGDPWGKFSRQIDYRKVATTKPHASHPNFVIEAGDDIWVSRAAQKDAICLTDPTRRVEFGNFPHDGVRKNGRIYFTTVNGYIHVVDEDTMTLAESIDLNKIDDRGVSLGWARSILPLQDGLCWVGFTRLRPTKLQDNLSWVKHGFKQFYLPTRIALYDLVRQKLLREENIEPYGIHAIFSILPSLKD
jgi:hypothetical protein